ncbi:TPA: AHH domain-containing protein, partial [Streptococcus suis]
YSGGYHSPSSSHAYAQQQQAQARAQAEQRRQQHIRDEYSQSTGIKTTPKTREAKSLFRNWGKALKEMYTHVCKTAKRVKKQVANYVKKIDWKKVAVTAGAIGVGIALTVATGGLGAPIAMAIGGAASGAILSGYDAYSSGQRGWGLAGSTLKGAGLGAITGFVGGQFIGAGANVAANVTQNIANQTVRHVVSAGVEAGVETAIDTGISVATGNPISLKNVATDYGLNLITNGSGSVSSKKSAKADIPTNKPKSGDVAVTKSRQSSTPVQQMSNPGPNKSRIPVEAVDGNGNKVYGELIENPSRMTARDVTSSQKVIGGQQTTATVTGGNSTQLGRNMLKSMGVSTNTGWKGYQAQHIIPAEFTNHPLIQKIGMNFDDASNGIFLPIPDTNVSGLSRHRGYHSTYNTFVKNQLDAIDINQPSSIIQQQIMDLQSQLRTLQQNGLPLYPSQGATVDLWQRSLNRIKK